MLVPVSNGGGPWEVLTAIGLPDMVVTLGRAADPEDEEAEEVVCGTPGNEGVGVGVLAGKDDCGGGAFGDGVGVIVGCCLFRRISRCLQFIFSAFIKESCKAEKKTRAA